MSALKQSLRRATINLKDRRGVLKLNYWRSLLATSLFEAAKVFVDPGVA